MKLQHASKSRRKCFMGTCKRSKKFARRLFELLRSETKSMYETQIGLTSATKSKGKVMKSKRSLEVGCAEV